MGQTVAKQKPEPQYDWSLSCRKLHYNENKNASALLKQYGRAVTTSQEMPLFEDQPTMCRCCPKADNIFLPNFASATGKLSKSHLETLLAQATTMKEEKEKEFNRILKKWKDLLSIICKETRIITTTRKCLTK